MAFRGCDAALSQTVDQAAERIGQTYWAMQILGQVPVHLPQAVPAPEETRYERAAHGRDLPSEHGGGQDA